MRAQILLITLLVLLPFPLFAQDEVVIPYKIKGYLEGIGNGKVYLYSYDKSKGLRVDSTRADNGDFVFSGVVLEPVLTYLLARSEYYSSAVSFKKQTPLQFFLENGYTFMIEGRYGTLDKAMVSGGLINADYKRYLNAIQLANGEKNVVESKLKNASDEDQLTLKKELKKANDKLFLQTIQFIKRNPNDLLSAWLIGNVVYKTSSMQVVEQCYNSLSAEVKQSAWGKKLYTQLYAYKTMQKGTMAPDFARKGVDGKDVYLSGFRGKYVLLNFWTSWCVTSRKDNIMLNNLVEQYSDKNLQLINVSLDKNLDNWVNAIRSDKLLGANVNAFFKDKEGKLAASYNVRTLPLQVLIGPDGKIIGRYNSAENLHKSLDSVLK
ncbi:TlpA disulfide reductase family protein [Solitalea lacus]|uniref:TlpA disulfide reductase family protein n=1 Tax=Solitalea lacus TaxID=2911172 RepID=UPI001EDB02DD|nr:TlpA disulfide reductase family protein [Solitalea lacus]UKJ06520.1 AhpC/TSA family protein [Solitalea lacus]